MMISDHASKTKRSRCWRVHHVSLKAHHPIRNASGNVVGVLGLPDGAWALLEARHGSSPILFHLHEEASDSKSERGVNSSFGGGHRWEVINVRVLIATSKNSIVRFPLL